MKLNGRGREDRFEVRASASVASDAPRGRALLWLGLALLGCAGSGGQGAEGRASSSRFSGGKSATSDGEASSGGNFVDDSLVRQDASAGGGDAGQVEGGSTVTRDGAVVVPGAGGEGGRSASEGRAGDDSGSVSIHGEASPGGGGGGASCTTNDCHPEAVLRCVCSVWGQELCCSGDWGALCQAIAEQKYRSGLCEPPPEPDAGVLKGACCEAHGGLGCDEANVEECVCDLVPDCCTVEWDRFCVQLAREKHCEPGVRACVCEEWEQASCCDILWGSVCAITAEEKCGAEPSCP